VKKSFLLFFLICGFVSAMSQQDAKPIHTGADQTEKYFSYLRNKRVAVVANPTSQIHGVPLVDSMLHAGIHVVKVFGPEHGFRGNASNGASVADSRYTLTGIPVISLYGKRSMPSRQDLEDVDIIVFDIQDVGTRFFTYIITLQNVMQSCTNYHKPLLVLDRPNPNGYFIDGPVLEDSLRSGVGLQPVPIVYGMTMAELAGMINGEGWLVNKLKCDLHIVKLANYTHASAYTLPFSPSPNLNTQQAVLLYPSLCLFEGTVVSIGRGTQKPFTMLGAPAYQGLYSFQFSPVSIPGMRTSIIPGLTVMDRILKI
jgi:uncharacterized protein YbbC (DUF1343 family)